jgi:hypothetical protein
MIPELTQEVATALTWSFIVIGVVSGIVAGVIVFAAGFRKWTNL